MTLKMAALLLAAEYSRDGDEDLQDAM